MKDNDLEYVRKQLERQNRVRGRLTQIAVASNLSRQTLTNILNGYGSPRLDNLVKLQKFLKMLEKSGVEDPININ